MGFPANAEMMRDAGYRYLETGECDACHQPVEWWRTPKKHEIPMEPMPTDWSPARSHWAMCAVLHPTKQSSFRGDPVPHPKLKNSEAVKE
jgi:hypothetical protein